MTKTKRRKAPRSKPVKTNLPRGAFEEWMTEQTVKTAQIVPEVRMPPDSYEEWITKQTKKKLSAK